MSTKATDTDIDIIAKVLLEKARLARMRSYSPYSKFKVGSALLGDDGNIYFGSNIENASYGLTICAERVAVFTAVSCGIRKIAAISISCENPSVLMKQEIMPCGACRQVIAEFSDFNTKIIIDGDRTYSIDELLPFAFKLKK